MRGGERSVPNFATEGRVALKPGLNGVKVTVPLMLPLSESRGLSLVNLPT